MSRTVRVLEVLDPPDGTTRYVDQLAHSLPVDVELVWFTWRRALFGRWDVLHVHWPERVVRARGRNPLRRLAVAGASVALLARLALTGAALVRTEHNPDPHEKGGRWESFLLDLYRRRTTVSVRINPTTAPHPTAVDALVLHGHYRDVFARHPREEQVPGRLLYFGLIRDYKGVDRLLAAFSGVREDLSLRLVGRPQTPAWRALVERAVEADPRVGARLEFVEDADLVAEVTASELVVLPYRELHNSGTVLVALSLDRPVLVPATRSTRALAEEVGPGWVHLLEGELTAQVLESTLTAVRSGGRSARPRLEGRDWDRVSAAYAQVLRLAGRGHRAVLRTRGR